MANFERGTDLYSRFVGRYSDGLADGLLRCAGVRPGDAALDVGCGSGAVLAALDARGAARIAGIDPSAPFLALARERVPRAEVFPGDAEALPFPDDSFDVAVAQLVVNFMSDAPAGVAEMRRVSRRTVAGCVWDYADGMTMLRAFWDAAREIDPGAPDESTMRYAGRGQLGDLWSEVGLRDVEDGEIIVTAGYEDFDDLWEPFPSGIGPAGGYCASLPPDGQAALREAYFRQLGEPQGPFELTARAWYATGTA